MKFKKYLNESSSRSKPLDVDKAKSLLTSKCSASVKQWKKGHKIYRKNSNIASKEAYFLEPGASHRESKYAAYNYYTEMINNHPMWSKYPEREIICSGGSGYRAKWHNGTNNDALYYVFPYNNAKIAICPSDDIWTSFTEVFDKFKIKNMNDFNREMFAMGVPTENWKEMKKYMKEKPYVKDNWSEETDTDETLYDVITKTMDPNKNGFKLVSPGQYKLTDNVDLEVWTDSKCVLIGYNYADEILNSL